MADKKQVAKSAFELYRDHIRRVLIGEAKAYGFTLLISGSILFLIRRDGNPEPLEVFFFALGAIAAFAIITLFSFGHFHRPHAIYVEEQAVPWSIIHLLSVLGGLVVAYLASIISPRTIAFGAVPFLATLVFNLLLGLESFLIAGLRRRAKEAESFGEKVVRMVEEDHRKSARRKSS